MTTISIRPLRWQWESIPIASFGCGQPRWRMRCGQSIKRCVAPVLRRCGRWLARRWMTAMHVGSSWLLKQAARQVFWFVHGRFAVGQPLLRFGSMWLIQDSARLKGRLKGAILKPTILKPTSPKLTSSGAISSNPISPKAATPRLVNQPGNATRRPQQFGLLRWIGVGRLPVVDVPM